MLIGEYSHNLDDKGRMVLPSKLRNSIGEPVISKGLHQCLWLMPNTRFTALYNQIAARPLGDPDAELVRCLFGAGAFDGTPDGQNRVAIPPLLRAYAGIEEQVIIVGMVTHVEIWSPERWAEHQKRLTDEAVQAALMRVETGSTCPAEPAPHE